MFPVWVDSLQEQGLDDPGGHADYPGGAGYPGWRAARDYPAQGLPAACCPAAAYCQDCQDFRDYPGG